MQLKISHLKLSELMKQTFYSRYLFSQRERGLGIHPSTMEQLVKRLGDSCTDDMRDTLHELTSDTLVAKPPGRQPMVGIGRCTGAKCRRINYI